MSKVLILTGPSGGGKSTIAERILAEEPKLVKPISVTTRQPRAGEVEGVDYHFVSPEEFSNCEVRHRFLETTKRHSNSYGMLKSTLVNIIKDGLMPLVVCDISGVENYQRLGVDWRAIFIDAYPTWTLAKRIKDRGSVDDLEVIYRVNDAAEQRKWLVEKIDAGWPISIIYNPLGRVQLDETVSYVKKGLGIA